MLEWIIVVVAGLGAGFFAGLLGIGGGILMVPLLHFVLGHDWHTSVAVSLVVMTIHAPLGVYRHHQKGAVSWRMAAPLVAGGVGGVLAGIWLAPRIAVPLLKLAFAVLMVLAAWRLVAKPPAPRTETRPWPILVLLGAGAGLVSRLLGVGGGILTVPALVLFAVPVHLAVGTSLVPVFSNAALATLFNVGRALPWREAAVLAATALVGQLGGVRAAHALPDKGLRRFVAASLVVAALWVAYRTFA